MNASFNTLDPHNRFILVQIRQVINSNITFMLMSVGSTLLSGYVKTKLSVVIICGDSGRRDGEERISHTWSGCRVQESDDMLQLYKTLIGSHWEYYILVRLTQLGKDVVKLERGKKIFPRMLLGLENLSCEKRLNSPELVSLDRWRLRDDF